MISWLNFEELLIHNPIELINFSKSNIQVALSKKQYIDFFSNKAVYITTNEDDLVCDYLLNELNLGITLIETRGGYTNKKDQLIMCVVPTGDYFELKSGVTQIDPKAVILVTDAYQTSGIYTGNTSII